MILNQRGIIMKAFIESQFGYCPLVWIFHGNRSLNNAMNKIEERGALRPVYVDYHRNLQRLKFINFITISNRSTFTENWHSPDS